MTRVAIVGASGYAGAELIRIVYSHPDLELGVIAAGTQAGLLLGSVHPQFASVPDLAHREFASTTAESLSGHDLVFIALPHGESAALVAQLPADQKIVDLGADFRLHSSQSWATYYSGMHAGTWTYGLPEIAHNRSLIRESVRVANPGCYATAIQLGLAPIVTAIDPRDVVVVAASGTSGAGRSAKVHLLASEVAGSMSTYKVGGTHQHTPEIEESLTALAGEQVQINFTPLLAPMSRGILATISVRTSLSYDELRAAFTRAYDTEPFVTLLPDGQLPVTASTYGSNAAHIQVAKDDRTGRASVFVAIDNLIKGAAGQAVQNANVMLGLDETLGLSALGVAP